MESGNSAVDRQEREDREAELYSGELKASEMTNEEKEALAWDDYVSEYQEAQEVKLEEEDYSLLKAIAGKFNTTAAEEALELARKDLGLDTREATYTLIIKGFLKYGRQGVKPGKPAGK